MAYSVDHFNVYNEIGRTMDRFWNACDINMFLYKSEPKEICSVSCLTRALQGYFYNTTDRWGGGYFLPPSPLRTQDLLVGFTKFK